MVGMRVGQDHEFNMPVEQWHPSAQRCEHTLIRTAVDQQLDSSGANQRRISLSDIEKPHAIGRRIQYEMLNPHNRDYRSASNQLTHEPVFLVGAHSPGTHW